MLVLRIIGGVIAIAAIIAGIYVGGWRFFIRPIFDIIDAVKEGNRSKDIVKALAKIFFGVPAVELVVCLICFVAILLMI